MRVLGRRLGTVEGIACMRVPARSHQVPVRAPEQHQTSLNGAHVVRPLGVAPDLEVPVILSRQPDPSGRFRRRSRPTGVGFRWPDTQVDGAYFVLPSGVAEDLELLSNVLVGYC